MKRDPATQRFKRLNIEFYQYVETLRKEWLLKNQGYPGKVYETMSPKEQAEVQDKIMAWREYITPLAEAWWQERGYELFWPEDDSTPVQLFELAQR
jgi:hypothetical protein